MVTLKSPALLPDESAASSGTDRTLAILETLSRHGHAGMTIAEMGRALDLPQNSVFRIMDTLHERGYVERDGSRRYALTGKLLDVARPKIGDKSLAACAFEALCALRDATGETAQLAVRSQHRCVLMEQVASRHPVKVLGELGLRIPLYSCAPGKAMLAFLPDAEQDAVLSRLKLEKHTEKTIVTKRDLATEIERIRTLGYALDKGEHFDGIHCVAAPILDQHGHAIGSVTIAGPSSRFPAAAMAERGQFIREQANRIARAFLS